MGSGRSAAVGVVAKGVDVHATLGVGIVAGDVPRHGGGRALVLLLKGDGALDVGVTTENSDYMLVSVALVRRLDASGSFIEASREDGGPSCPSRSPIEGHPLDAVPHALPSAQEHPPEQRLPAGTSMVLTADC